MESNDEAWHALTPQEVAAQQEVDLHVGLSDEEATRRLGEAGPNRLREEQREPLWQSFLEELREPMILLLLVTGVLYAVWGETSDALTIFFVILTLNSIEVYNEHRAKKAIAALHKLAEPTAAVRREGRILEVAAEEIVPGDLIVLRAGRRVPADARIVEASGLTADESSLTGESIPVEKSVRDILDAGAPLAERSNMVYAGAVVTRGRGAAIVVATGRGSELGRLAHLAGMVKPPRTPLQQAMSRLSGYLVWVALGFSVAVPLLGWWLTEQPLQQLALTGLSLAFATIPEEMPIIITMVLALGAYRLSGQRAIVKDLQAVETLGAVTVIATDKTGTLTENHVRVSELFLSESKQKLLTVGSLCNDATEYAGEFTGDPLDVALLEAARDAGIDVPVLRESHPLRQEFPFDSERKLMSVVCVRNGERPILPGKSGWAGDQGRAGGSTGAFRGASGRARGAAAGRRDAPSHSVGGSRDGRPGVARDCLCGEACGGRPARAGRGRIRSDLCRPGGDGRSAAARGRRGYRGLPQRGNSPDHDHRRPRADGARHRRPGGVGREWPASDRRGDRHFVRR